MAEPTEPSGELAATDPLGPLWLERVAASTGFDALARRLGIAGHGTVLMVLTLPLVDRTVVAGLAYLQTGRVEATVNPIILSTIVLWPLATFLALWLRDRAGDIISSVPDPHPSIEESQMTGVQRRALSVMGIDLSGDGGGDPTGASPPRLLTARMQAVLLLLFVAYHVVALVVFPPNWSFIQTYWGPTVIAIRHGLFMPAFYALASQLVAIILAIHVALPLWISETGRLDFADPHGYGGMRPIGNLLKVSTLLYLAGVTSAAVFFVANISIEASNLYPDTTVLAGMTGGVVLFFAPAYWLHRHMRAAKEARIDDIAEDIRRSGPEDDEEMFPETRANSPDEGIEYTHGYIQLSQVRSMHEYPIDVSMVQEFLFVLLLPYVAHVSSIYVFEHLHL
ncbi:MAG: hypothetical protein ABEI31_07465 [Halodesulfurarchaeum sp.]